MRDRERPLPLLRFEFAHNGRIVPPWFQENLRFPENRASAGKVECDERSN